MNSHGSRHIKNSGRQRASVTVEAALTLPIFIFAILAIAYIIRILYAQAIIQTAMYNAADDMALSCYSFYRLDDTVTPSGLSVSALNTSDSFLESYNTAVYSGDEAAIADAFDNFRSYYSDGGVNAVSGENGLYLYQLLLTENMSGLYGQGGGTPSERAEALLKKLNIKPGGSGTAMSGLDFSGTNILNGDNLICIQIKYTVNIPLPIKPPGDMIITQRAFVRAWGQGN
jgi:hypothetical protein